MQVINMAVPYQINNSTEEPIFLIPGVRRRNLSIGMFERRDFVQTESTIVLSLRGLTRVLCFHTNRANLLNLIKRVIPPIITIHVGPYLFTRIIAFSDECSAH